jgi:hypothetical protein
MRICIVDTETTSTEKPFVYNIGYMIYDTDEKAILLREDFIAEQIWHNLELFTTAYFADKREGYISAMKSQKCRLEKLGHITQRMKRLFKAYEVTAAFAYNSPFDERVFNFNCDWFKIQNPFDNIPFYDIQSYAQHFICFNKDYQNFCDEHHFYTESGNYSQRAEHTYAFISNNPDFIEAHTALADCEIELQILLWCIDKGAEFNKEYKKYASIPRRVEKVLEVKTVDGEKVRFPYKKIVVYKEKDNKTRIILKNPLDK